jgi:RNA polymerase sigma factor (sigma-70 family)
MVTMAPVIGAQQTDADVIAAAVRDPAAFAELFDRHYASIHGFLRARVGEGLADELASETFLQALRSVRRYDRTFADARPWLFAIATNLVGRHRRSEGRRLRAYARVELPPPTDGPSGEALAPALAAALQALAPADRDALLLVAWGELTYEEAARAAGIPIGTLRSRIHRARSQLRKLLGENGGTT